MSLFLYSKCKEKVIIDVKSFVKRGKGEENYLMVIGMICLGTEARENL